MRTETYYVVRYHDGRTQRFHYAEAAMQQADWWRRETGRVAWVEERTVASRRIYSA